MDPVLQLYLRATTAVEEQRQISHLLSSAVAPVARGIINRTLVSRYEQAGRPFRTMDFEEAASEVTWRILARLRERKAAGSSDTIPNFQRFVAASAHDVCSELFRAAFPGRYSIECKLRYLIGRRPDWAVWENAEGELYCGLASWKGQPIGEPAKPPGPLDPVRDQGPLTPKSLERFAAETFVQTDRPLRLADVTCAAVLRWPPVEPPKRPVPPPLPFPDSGRYLARLWREVLELPLAQRRALLLHLRDERGGTMLDVFAAACIANFEAIATALDMPWLRMLETWNALPLDDAAIARLLVCSREEAAGYRRVARERLSLAMRQR